MSESIVTLFWFLPMIPWLVFVSFLLYKIANAKDSVEWLAPVVIITCNIFAMLSLVMLVSRYYAL